MVERLVITLLLILLGSGAYFAWKQLHMQRVQPAAVTGNGPRLLYFRSNYCPPCVTQARFLEQLPSQVQRQVSIQKIDAEEERELAASYGVFTLPTTLLVDREGSVRHINYGLTDTAKLMRQVESIL